MKFLPLLFSDARGSIGGVTFSRNTSGLYARSRAIPVNPNTNEQNVVRSIFAQLPIIWQDILTENERDEWKNYASNVTIADKLGQQIHISNVNHFVRSNVGRIQAGLDRIDVAPSTYNLGVFTHPSLAISDATDEVTVGFDDGDGWVSEDGAAMLVYTSRPVAPTVNFFTGPYRYAGKIEGDSVGAPTTPAAIPLSFAAQAGQKVGVLVRVSRGDGRLSEPFRGLVTVAA